MLGCTLALLACDDTGRRRDPPPDGLPWLAHRYQVSTELLASTCAPGGLGAMAQAATADVVQRGIEVEWEQRSEAPDAETLFLEGTLCAADDDGAVLRMLGGRRDTVAGCQVITTVPPSDAGDLVDDCNPSGLTTLSIDQCGIITGVFDTELEFKQDCAHRSSCRLTVRIVARPTVLDSRAPKRPAACL